MGYYNLTLVATKGLYQPSNHREHISVTLKLNKCPFVSKLSRNYSEYSIFEEQQFQFHERRRRCENQFGLKYHHIFKQLPLQQRACICFCMHILTQKQHSRNSASLPPCPRTLLHSRQHQSSQSSSSTEPGCWQKVG